MFEYKQILSEKYLYQFINQNMPICKVLSASKIVTHKQHLEDSGTKYIKKKNNSYIIVKHCSISRST